MNNYSFKPDPSKTYILGNVERQSTMCTLKFDKKGRVCETIWDGTDMWFMRTMAQWIISGGDCTFPGNNEQHTYLLVECE
uniref:Uncharacterized protein n=1 Tax=viral metagenome TaxID=1070528 RepID=A0A6C0JX82_9ZZZZ